MSYLLDTNVVSETRKRSPDPHVFAWLQDVAPNELFLSVLTIGELARGIAKRRRTDPAAAASLAHWLAGIDTLYGDRIVPIDTAVATVWGELTTGRSLPVIDSLLAATAKVHGMTVVTRNTRDIEPTGVPCLNPWHDG